MNAPKHTPKYWRGLWTCTKKDDNSGYIPGVILRGDEVLAHICDPDIAEHLTACNNACQGGNPAAVPDLVAALDTVMGWFSLGDVQYLMSQKGEASSYNQAMREATQALAKWREGGAS